MAKYILIRLIDGTEYYVNQKKQVFAKIEGLTGKRTNVEPSSSWTIEGFWYKKLLGGKAVVDMFEFLTNIELGNLKYQDKKDRWKYGVQEVHHGSVLQQEPLTDYGVSFVQLREDDK
jgi:hypothetical protein